MEAVAEQARYHVLIADEIDNTQRTLIHEMVKNASEDWWHQFANVWVVRSVLTTSEWRERLEPFCPVPPSSILVLAMKEKPGGRWGIGGKVDHPWFRQNMSKPNTEAARTKPE